jgi:hypothetical protein
LPKIYLNSKLFATTTYGAGNQNWMIAQDKNQILYFANNEDYLSLMAPTGAYIPHQTKLLFVLLKLL